MKDSRDPLMKHVDNAERLKAFRVVQGGKTRKPRRTLTRLQTALLCLAVLVTIISIPWFVGVTTIVTGIWAAIFNR